MRKNLASVPEALRNGGELPRRFSHICPPSSPPPRYKITVYSRDELFSRQRLIHAFYISVIADDPSNIQKFMKSRSRQSVPGFEDGQIIDGMMAYKEHLLIKNMIGFKEMLRTIVNDNAQNYAMTSFYSIVQYSNIPTSDSISLFSIDFD